jgi:hypothetical protein
MISPGPMAWQVSCKPSYGYVTRPLRLKALSGNYTHELAA